MPSSGIYRLVLLKKKEVESELKRDDKQKFKIKILLRIASPGY